MFHIVISNHQRTLPIDRPLLRRAVRAVLERESIGEAQVSVVIVDDPAIRQLNRQYLNHDCATDVLSFTLDRDSQRVEGEVIISADTACSAAPRFGWPAADELLLYVIHGALHLVGYEDGSRAERARMRAREREHLAALGVKPRYRQVRQASGRRRPGCAGTRTGGKKPR